MVVILWRNDKSQQQILRFKEAVAKANLKDMGCYREDNAWYNGREGGAEVWEKLDNFCE